MKSKAWLKQHWVEIFLLLCIIFLLFWRLDRADMTSDDAPFAFRSVGLVDFMYSAKQTTPWQWFNPLPWWSFLSFHDAPPLAFFITHASFKLFGVSLWAARFPAALAGICSAILLYLIARRLGGQTVGRWALAFIAVNPAFVWLHQYSYFEPLLMPWLLLGLYSYLKAESNSRWYYLVAVSFGLAFLTKYTAVILLATVAVHWLLFRRSWSGFKRLLWPVVVAVVIISPVIIYNILMFLTRGHMDVQIGGLLGQSNYDWPILQTALSRNIIGNSLALFHNITNLQSILLTAFGGLAVAWFCYQMWASRQWQKSLWLILLFFWFIFMVLTRQDYRFVATGYFFAPLFLALYMSNGDYKRKWWQMIIAVPIMIISLAYSLNTNHLTVAWGNRSIYFSEARRESYSYNQLTQIIEQENYKKKPTILFSDAYYDSFDPYWAAQRVHNFDDELKPGPESDTIFIFDQNVQWFAEIWHLKRLFFYQRDAIVSSRDMVDLLSGDRQSVADTFGGKRFVFFKLASGGFADNEKYQTEIDPRLIKMLTSGGVERVITNPDGSEAFEVYSGRFAS